MLVAHPHSTFVISYHDQLARASVIATHTIIWPRSSVVSLPVRYIKIPPYSLAMAMRAFEIAQCSRTEVVDIEAELGGNDKVVHSAHFSSTRHMLDVHRGSSTS